MVVNEWVQNRKMTKIEGQHLCLADAEACPYDCFLHFDLLSVDVSTEPVHVLVASYCVA